MISDNKIFRCLLLLIPLFGTISCQKMSRPALGEYPTDNPVTPSTSLRFYLPFDSLSADASQINIRFADSISSYPSFFPDNSVTYTEGVRGTAYSSSSGYFLSYYNTNDFLATAQSFTVAFWEKRDGRPDGEAEFPFAFPSANGHWAGTSMMLLFDHQGAGATDELAVLKFVIVDKDVADTWLTWEGSDKIPGIQDGNWHHLAFTYNAETSTMHLFVDGVQHPHAATWGTHGGANMDASKSTGFKLGGRPTEDLGWGRSWKGGIDQFRLYNTVLSASEIQDLYNNKQ